MVSLLEGFCNIPMVSLLEGFCHIPMVSEGSHYIPHTHVCMYHEVEVEDLKDDGMNSKLCVAD